MTRVISLLTDFGLNDEYVGVMKGVILSHCSTVQIVDITHAIPPQNISLAARAIASSYSFFPETTIHVIVVDPDVGTDRSILVAEADKHIFIAPDNGVLSPVLSSAKLKRCYSLEKPTEFTISNTFHGRDLMAPLAGKIASGMDITKAGPKKNVADCCFINIPKANVTPSTIIGEVVNIDIFGNIATSISVNDLASLSSDVTVTISGISIRGLSRTYTDKTDGELLALIDSRDHLEIAKNCGNAAETLQCKIGDKVTVQRYKFLE